MAFLRKMQQLLELYPDEKKKQLAPKIIEYFSCFIRGNRKKQAVERIIKQSIKSSVGDIGKRRILYCLIKNNQSRREEAGFKSKIRDRFFDLFHKEEYAQIKGTVFERYKKNQLYKVVDNNWINLCSIIDDELEEFKDEGGDFYDPFNDIAYDINIELNAKRDLEPLYLKSFPYLSTISTSNPYISSPEDENLLSYKEFITAQKKLVPVCTINNHFRNLVFLPGKRYWKYVKYYKFGKLVMKEKKTLILLMRGEIRNLNWNVAYMTANNKYVEDGSIKEKTFATFESVVGSSIGNEWYLFCYHFCPFSMKLQSVKDIFDANLFVSLRMKSQKFDCKIITKSNPTTDPTIDPTTDPTTDSTIDPTTDPTIDPTIDLTTDPTTDPTINPTVYPTAETTTDAIIGTLSEYEVSKYFVIAYEIYLLMRANSNNNITDQRWGFFYECFERETGRKLKKYYWYQGVDESGQFKISWSWKTVIELERFIKIDKLEVATRLKKWLNTKDWNLESKHLEFLKQKGNDYCELNIGADGYIYLDIEKHILEEQVVQYGRTINGGIGVVDDKKNKFKHYNGGAYTWKGHFDMNDEDDRKEFERLNKIANGIRMLYGDDLAGIYYVECLNCMELGILSPEEVANNVINMGAGNYYHNKGGDAASSLQGHTEHKKFDKVIGISYGEMSYLCIGMGVQGKVSGLTAVPSRNGSITDYKVGKFCMDSIPHSVNEMHLMWKVFGWRLAKLLRHIRDENVEAAEEHHEVCDKKGHGERHCGCVGLSKGPFKDPFGRF